MLKEERKRREEILSNLLEERLRVKPVAEVVIPELTEVNNFITSISSNSHVF